MYKVFINNKRLILANNKDPIDYNNATVICLKNPETINIALRNHLLKSSTSDLIILSPDDKKLIESFESNYEVRMAAGGWVWNEKEYLLMIFREGHWDLPKGHLEAGETLEKCAVREVCEETGISQLTIKKKLGVSRHIYEYEGRMVLKATHWFSMSSISGESLIPQTEEGISEVKWVKETHTEEYLKKSWKSLKEFYYEYVK